MDPQKVTVKELRLAGWKVRCTHYRYPTLSSDLTPVREIRDEVGSLRWVESKGGKIEVELHSPDGKAYVGAAECSRKDPFNARIGRKIALARALTPKKAAETDGANQKG